MDLWQLALLYWQLKDAHKKYQRRTYQPNKQPSAWRLTVMIFIFHERQLRIYSRFL